MKQELYERLEQLGVLTESELVELKEAVAPVDTGWVASMYGAPVPREKNINRVVAGLRAHMNDPQPIGFQPAAPGVPMQGGASERYVQALEMQIQHLARQVKQLHNQYNKLTRSYNNMSDRVNALTRQSRQE